MKKILLFINALLVLCLVSCNSDKPVKTNVAIPTEFAGFILGGCYTQNECETVFAEYVENLVLINVDKYGAGKKYDLVPLSFLSSETFSFAGYIWTYLRLFVNDKDMLTGIQFTFTADEFEPITDHYETLKDVLADKYGRAREVKEKDKSRYCRWTDGTTMLVLSVEESATMDGETRSFCILSYYNTELQMTLENSGKTEL